MTIFFPQSVFKMRDVGVRPKSLPTGGGSKPRKYGRNEEGDEGEDWIVLVVLAGIAYVLYRLATEKDRILQQKLLQRRLQRVDTSSDGNCQFTSVARQMVLLRQQRLRQRLGNPPIEDWMTDHVQLRARAVAFVQRVRRDIEPNYMADPTFRLDRMARNGEWGDEHTLVALAYVLRVTIHIISSEDYTPGPYNPLDIAAQIGEPNRDPIGEITLGHISERHYVSAEPIG